MKMMMMVENEKEREFVQNLIARLREHNDGVSWSIGNGYGDAMIGDGAVVYDCYNGHWVVYDFENEKMHMAEDTASLFNLPSNCWPF